MKSRLLHHRAIAFWIAISLCVQPLFALPREKDRWIELKTENFTFFSNLPRAKTLHFAENLEHLRSIFALAAVWDLHSPVPTYVYIFGNQREFDPYKPIYKGKPLEVAGYFQGHPNGNFIALNGSARSEEQTMETVYHEYLHYLIRNNFPGVPLWLNEGLAEYYSTFTVFKNRADVGLPIVEHLRWLQTYDLIPLQRLFEISNGSIEYNEGLRRGVFYAQSWAIVHYLLRGSSEREGQLSRFLELTVGEGLPTDEAFSQAFDADYPTMEKELRRYVRSLRMDYVRIRVEDLPEATIRVRELEYAETLANLGNLLAHHFQDRSSDAEKHFQESLGRAPKNSTALAGMADLLVRRGEDLQARSLYKDALESGVDDPLLEFRYAELLLIKTESSAEQREEAKASLRRVVERRPDYAPAWRLLTYSYTFEDELPDAAVQAGEKAFALQPGEEDVSHNLLQIYLRRGDLEPARRLVRVHFQNSTPRRQFERAATDLLNAEMLAVTNLLSDRKIAEGLEALEDLRQAVLLPEHAERIDARIALVRQKLQEQKRSETYAEALKKMNQSEDDEATKILEELAAGEDVVALKAQQSLREIELRKERKSAPVRRAPSNQRPVIVDRGVRVIDQGGVVRHNAFVDEFNKAVDLFNQKDAAGAVALLEELLPKLEEGSENFLKARQLLFKARSQL